QASLLLLWAQTGVLSWNPQVPDLDVAAHPAVTPFTLGGMDLAYLGIVQDQGAGCHAIAHSPQQLVQVRLSDLWDAVLPALGGCPGARHGIAEVNTQGHRANMSPA